MGAGVAAVVVVVAAGNAVDAASLKMYGDAFYHCHHCHYYQQQQRET